MVNKLVYISLLLLAFCSNAFAQLANNNCASATTLTSGAAPLCSQTVDNATVQAGEVVAPASTGATATFTETVWYKFVATSSTMFVEWEFTGLVSGATWCPGELSMVVYNTATCIPAAGSILATESTAADGSIVMHLTGLTSGNTYLVQVGYGSGGGCQEPIFCMAVGDEPAPCSCASPCAAGCGYASTPSVATVTSTCPEYVLTPLSDGGETETYCYSFTAASTTVSFSMVITSNCSGGNVTALTWTLQTSGCGASVATGTLASMSATTVVGTSYVLCYTYTIPAGCHHSSLYPYFVGATPLSIELLSFDAENYMGDKAKLMWVTASEANNNYFTLERSYDGNKYSTVGVLNGAGNSNEINRYELIDNEPAIGVNYYRLKQTDYDGNSTYSRTQTIMFEEMDAFNFSISPNPASSEPINLAFSGFQNNDIIINVYDISGTIVFSSSSRFNEQGTSNVTIKNSLKSGCYFVNATSGGKSQTQKLIVN